MKKLAETLELLLEHRWLFQSPVTEVLVNKVLDQFPKYWIEALESLTIDELNNLVIGKFMKDDWPLSLRQFVEKCTKIKGELSNNTFVINSQVENEFLKIPKQLTIGLNVKKQHEAFYLAQLTHEMCEKEGLEVIVDLGAGLGYVCQILHHLYKYRVLGLESNPSITTTANHRRNTLHPLSSSSVQYACLKVTENSSIEIEKLVKSFTNDDNSKICLIGLHSCGDLSTTAAKLFNDMDIARLLIMMSCCYHKMEYFEDRKCFRNFPMSEGLKKELKVMKNDSEKVIDVLGRPFMRLACQEASERWEDMTQEDHDVHSICLMARGVVELFCHQNRIKLTKTKRKSARTWQCVNFDGYLKNFVLRYNLNGQSLDEKYYKEIKQLWEVNKVNLRKSEVYTGLQLLLQAPAEYLVLEDRKHWLEEKGFTDTRILSVLDKKLSPRSYAIVSSKRNYVMN